MHPQTLAYRSADPTVVQLADRHGRDPAAVVEMLRALQTQRGRLTSELIQDVARELRLPASRVHGIATFYAMLAAEAPPARTIRICDGPACLLRGAGSLLGRLPALPDQSWTITRTSCLGLCDLAPAALVRDEQVGPVTLDRVAELAGRWCGEVSDYRQPRPGETRILLPDPRATASDPRESAVAGAAFSTLPHALSRTPELVLAEIEASGLRGRGGAGFPAGRKWRLVAQENRTPKYVVANADESEPLSFKDRVLLDLQPHLVLEGMAITAYAVGASAGYVYIRGEYTAQAERLHAAIEQARRSGWLGSRIAGSEFGFDVHVHRGAGAYICGEETALLESLEGKRGEPRLRPPFPTTSGYRGQPTAISNVETFAAVPQILARGAAWYRSIGNPQTPGTKLYTVLGDVDRPGLFEAPYGITLRQIIDVFGGGMRPGSTFRFALTGGAAGTLVPPALLDVPIDYESGAQGVSLGSGGFLVCDQSVSPVKMLRELLHFFEMESCGKCTPCRIGTREARQVLDRFVGGAGSVQDLKRLTDLARLLQSTSLCGLGTSSAKPIQSALTHFRECFDTGGTGGASHDAP
jgi:NADH:ubiquinone oxidoreductase subunit F (NADH-binding)/NADH:ubiquinone oxidoreductase subunit E